MPRGVYPRHREEKTSVAEVGRLYVCANAPQGLPNEQCAPFRTQDYLHGHGVSCPYCGGRVNMPQEDFGVV